MKPRMRRPHVTSTEDKVRESVLINALLKSKNMKQLELARLLGYKPDAIGQWFHKTKPTAIPDCAYAHCAAILEFDPTSTRPWLNEMYESLDKVYSSEPKAAPVMAMLQNLLGTLSDADRAALIQSFEQEKK